MNWIVAHLYVSLIALVALSFLGGAVLVRQGALHSPSDSVTTWSGSGGFAFLGGGSGETQTERTRTEDLLKEQAVAEYSILPVGTSKTVEIEPVDFDWQSLLNELTGPGTASSQSNDDVGNIDVYSYIPKGLISTEQPVETKTPLQESLFDYGNRAGSLIRGFDDAHTNMIQVLKNAYEDKNNPDKLAAAIKIGTDYEKLGRDLEEMENVPGAISSMHMALSRAYQDSGRKMVIKLQTKTDEEFLAAMNTYNDSVLAFTKRYVAIVTFFSAAGVRFSQNDPGSVFMFQAMGEM